MGPTNPDRTVLAPLLAACSAYIYFNLGELEFTHYLVIVSVVAVLAMALLDCRVSDDYWRKREAQDETDKRR